MKKILKYIAYLITLIVIIVVGLLANIKIALPNVAPAPQLKVEITPSKLARGKYLANHVMLCVDCHSKRDWTLFSGPMVTGTEGMGGETFDQNMGFPGKYIAPNLTPSNLSNWTDGEIFRAITSGVNKEDKALFTIMPYHQYGKLDKADIEAVIAYIRSLRLIENKIEPSSSDFPMSFIINTMPKKAMFSNRPPITDKTNYDKYITTAAGCMECHTKQENGKFVGEPFAGGFEFKLNDGSIVRSANLTPDDATGLGAWTLERFLIRFKMYADSSYKLQKVVKGDFQTTMPWTMYAGMTDEDLTAIYNYLRTLTPVRNKIDKFTAVK